MNPARLRAIVSGVLIVGVSTSAALMTVALIASLFVGWEGSLAGSPGAPGWRPIDIAQAGLLVLVATPVVRVAASVIAFALERDRLYTAITLAVLGILLFSMLALR